MADSILDSFLIRLGYTIDKSTESQATQSIKHISTNLDTLKEHTQAVADSFLNVKTALVGLATASVFKGTFDVVNETSQKFAQLADVANEIGNTTAEEIAKFGYVLQQNGSSAEESIKSYRELTKKIGDAVAGGGEGVEVFQKLGISLKNENGNIKSTNIILDELSEKLQGLDRADQVNLIDKLGLDISTITALTSDTKALQEQFTQVYKSVNVDINELSTKSQDFQGSYNSLVLLFDVIKDALGAKFIDSVKKSIDQFYKIIFDNLPRITKILASVITVINAVAKAFINVGELVFKAISKVIDTFNNLSSVYKVLIVGMVALWAYMNNAFLRSPIGILFQLITAIGLLIDDFKVWKEGGQSLIEWNSTFGKTLQFLATNPIARAIGGLSALMLVFSSLRTPIFALIKVIPLLTASFIKFSLALLANPIGLVIVAITALITAGILLYKNFDVVKEKLTKAFEYIKDVFNTVTNTIKEKINNTIEFIKNLPSELVSFFKNLPTLVINAVKNLPSTLISIFDTFFNYLKEKFSWALDTFNTVKEIVTNPLETAGKATDAIKDYASNAVNGALDTVSNTFKSFFKDDKELDTNNNNVTTNNSNISNIQNFLDNTKNLTNNLNNESYLTTSNIYNSTNNSNSSSENKTINQNNNGDVNITIQATNDPQKTAEKIASIQDQVNANIVRNLRRDIY